jgi:hypothetical protein
MRKAHGILLSCIQTGSSYRSKRPFSIPAFRIFHIFCLIQTADETLLPADIIVPVMYPGRTLCCFTRNTYVNRPTHHWYMTTELSELEITTVIIMMLLTQTQ